VGVQFKWQKYTVERQNEEPRQLRGGKEERVVYKEGIDSRLKKRVGGD